VPQQQFPRELAGDFAQLPVVFFERLPREWLQAIPDDSLPVAFRQARANVAANTALNATAASATTENAATANAAATNTVSSQFGTQVQAREWQSINHPFGLPAPASGGGGGGGGSGGGGSGAVLPGQGGHNGTHLSPHELGVGDNNIGGDGDEFLLPDVGVIPTPE